MEYEKLKKEDLQKFHKQMPLSKVMISYIDKIKDLGADEVGHFTVQAGEKAGSIKMRLLRASRLAGIPITVKRFGNDVVFYEEQPIIKETKKIKK